MKPGNSPAERALAEQLLEIVRALSLELRPQAQRLSVSLDSSLDRDLGFDSLSRVELLLRVERSLDVQLPEAIISAAETPRDLLQAALTARARETAPAAVLEPIRLGDALEVPGEANTLQSVLAFHAETQPERVHVRLYEADATTPIDITYGELQTAAERVAAGLLAQGIAAGASIAIMLPTCREYLESFFGVLLAGAVPVPIYPPARPSQLEDHLLRHARILENADARLLITVPEAKIVGRLLKGHVQGLGAVLTPAELSNTAASYTRQPAAPDDVALLQYTSGSTGQPKGVILTHSNLLSNIRIMGGWVNAEPEDVFVSWLPMYHDMGLIGAWLGSLYFAMLAVIMPPTAFLARPWRWLRAIQEHRATVAAAPNFAYELCLSKIPDSELEGLDLSSLRMAVNGAEPVSPRTVRRFIARFADYGFDPLVMTPVYGLAESAVGLAFPPLERGPLIDRIDRDAFERSGKAVPASEEHGRTLEFVACGQPLPGYDIRIVDAVGKELPERAEGRLEFRGPSATSGYVRNPDATAALFDGDWLDSGDLAYMSEGDVYLTSRVKDLIIRAGRNVYPYDLEEAVGDLPEIRKGCVAVFASRDPAADTELLVVLAETRETDPAVQQAASQHIERLANDLLGIAPDRIVLAPPRTVLKTSSGKIRRAACRELFEQGRIGRGARAPWWQLVRLWVGGLKPRWRRARNLTAALGFALWSCLCFGLLLPVAVLALLVLPGVGTRWRTLSACGRLLLRLVRVPLLVKGREQLAAAGRCVVVANHASYLDGLVLIAALPSPVAFIAKRELKEQRFAHWFLSKLGAQFVERFDIERGTADARRLATEAGAGAQLLFFPEGTFTRSPGLLPFHMGAFATAAENGLPILPISLRGTRSVLRSGTWMARPGAIALVIGAPISVDGHDWQAALALRNEARREILRHCGEPDLATEGIQAV